MQLYETSIFVSHSSGLIWPEICRRAVVKTTSRFTEAPRALGLSADHIKSVRRGVKKQYKSVLCARRLALTWGEEVKAKWEKRNGKHGEDGDRSGCRLEAERKLCSLHVQKVSAVTSFTCKRWNMTLMTIGWPRSFDDVTVSRVSVLSKKGGKTCQMHKAEQNLQVTGSFICSLRDF